MCTIISFIFTDAHIVIKYLIFTSKCNIIALGGENMIKTTAMLKNELAEYVNPDSKIRRLVDDGKLFVVARGIYETDRNVSGYCLAGVIYGPSYLSFEFAMGFQGLIPEAVYTFTSATFGKKKKKQFDNVFGVYTYRDVPDEVYPYGVELKEENGYSFWIASPEKAICDMLYKASPMNNLKELKELLFNDLRIDENVFKSLNYDKLIDLSKLYKKKNHKLLISFLNKEKKNG